MMLEASSASGSAQYLLARIKQASADSIYVYRIDETDILPLLTSVVSFIHFLFYFGYMNKMVEKKKSTGTSCTFTLARS